MRRSGAGWGWLLAYTIGCAPAVAPSADEPAVRRDAIVGGVPAPLDTGVFLLEVTFGERPPTTCSATLIAPRTLLTAAHCLDPAMAGATSASLRAANRQLASDVLPEDWLQVVQTRWHPGFNVGADLQHDVGLALLERAPKVAPVPWNEGRDLSAAEGQALRAVGFGRPNPANPAPPERRSAQMLFRRVTATDILLGDLASSGICLGDSGGPALHTFEDGVERVVGLHSRTRNAACTDGVALRVDAYRDFIEAWLSEYEGLPACAADGRCKQGCPQVDPDCACAADKACSALCDAPETDPDCPAGCGADGTCVRAGCGRPDPDCLADGAPCVDRALCAGERCAADLQHDGPYCSRACPGEGCAPGMACLAGLCRFLQHPAAEEGLGRSVAGRSPGTAGSCQTAAGVGVPPAAVLLLFLLRPSRRRRTRGW